MSIETEGGRYLWREESGDRKPWELLASLFSPQILSLNLQAARCFQAFRNSIVAIRCFLVGWCKFRLAVKLKPWIHMRGAVAAKTGNMKNVTAWFHMRGAEAERQAEVARNFFFFFPLGGAIHSTAAGLSHRKRGMARYPPDSDQDV